MNALNKALVTQPLSARINPVLTSALVPRVILEILLNLDANLGVNV
jgi:hypothetical protein